MAAIRLQKYIADCGFCSRRKAEELIYERKVKVNGIVVDEMGVKITPGVDRITIGRKPVLMAPKGVLLLNKPREVMSTRNDPGGRKTVADYLTKKYSSYYPVGRLDYESTGLVIMTNDGQLAHRLMHPKYGQKRIYQVQVAGVITEKTLRRINRGVRLKDGMVYAEARIIRKGREATHLKITILEGRNRIIRRLMDHLRHPVIKLERVAHGPFQLRKIKKGAIRVYTAEEYRKIKKKVMEGTARKPAKKLAKKSAETPAEKSARPKTKTSSKTGRTGKGRASSASKAKKSARKPSRKRR